VHFEVNRTIHPATSAKSGKPRQNSLNAHFNGRLRDECLNAAWFRNRAKVRALKGAEAVWIEQQGRTIKSTTSPNPSL